MKTVIYAFPSKENIFFTLLAKIKLYPKRGNKLILDLPANSDISDFHI